LRPYIKDKDVACVVFLMGNCVSYPELMMLSDGEIVFNVVDYTGKDSCFIKEIS